MKRLILTLAFASCFGFSMLKAQTVNNLKLSELKEEYLRIGENELIGRTFITIDYGQKRRNSNDLLVKDANGKNFEFNSTIDFFNRMKVYGYELVQVYTEILNGNSSNKYILRRKSN